MSPPASRASQSPLGLPEASWTLVAALALGAMVWLPRFQQRLPRGPVACPPGAPEAAETPGVAYAGLSGKAPIPGALGETWLALSSDGATLELAESDEVRWVLCPLAIVVGATLGGLALAGLARRRRRPKAAAMYAVSAALGVALAGAALRCAAYSQTIRLSAATVAMQTDELWGAWRTRLTLPATANIKAWRAGEDYELYAVPIKREPKGCGRLLRARWLEPGLAAALNRIVERRP